MKPEKNRIDILNEFYSAPPETLVPQTTLCAILECSRALAERNRWAGKGVPFIKVGRLVRYRKQDILSFLGQHQALNSTSEYKRGSHV